MILSSRLIQPQSTGGKASLAEDHAEISDNSRCLSCSSICESCVEVCPNRANISIRVPGLEKHQIIHLDSLCNACGNCKNFCPYDSAPYLEKFTLFASVNDMDDSKNQGFTVIDQISGSCKIRMDERVFDFRKGEAADDLPDAIQRVITAVLDDYTYLL